eukprot:2123023-Pyramimonas_sp.AAC.1
MGGCRGPDLSEASRTHGWSDSGHQHSKKGVHAPVRQRTIYLAFVWRGSKGCLLGPRTRRFSLEPSD